MMDKNYTTRALVYDTTINGTETTCLHKFIIRETEEEFEEMRQKEIRETKLNLRYDDGFQADCSSFRYRSTT